MMKQIQLTQGKVAIVDDEDYERLNKHKWYANKGHDTFYAVRNSPRLNGKQTHIFMHRVILGLELGDTRQVDHKNRNSLDNWRDNLRTCNGTQNKQNGNPYRNGSSAFKGVTWEMRERKWRARIKLNGKLKHLGYFDSEIEAAIAYDEAARKYFNQFAYTNY